MSAGSEFRRGFARWIDALPAGVVFALALGTTAVVGMTDELNVGHYFKRLTAIDTTFGDSDHHLSRFAAAAETKTEPMPVPAKSRWKNLV